jgi:hypothetical protein
MPLEPSGKRCDLDARRQAQTPSKPMLRPISDGECPTCSSHCRRRTQHFVPTIIEDDSRQPASLLYVVILDVIIVDVIIIKDQASVQRSARHLS